MATGHQFYEIKSYKSLIVCNHLRKRSLACKGDAGVHCFFWVDDRESIKQVQFLFDEQVMEWSAKKGVTTGLTNRFFTTMNLPSVPNKGYEEEEVGRKKGIRTVRDYNSQMILEKGLKIIETSSFPGSLGKIVAQCFTQSKLLDETPQTLPDEQADQGGNCYFHFSVQNIPCIIFKLVAAADGIIDEDEMQVFDTYSSEYSPINSPLGKLIFEEFRKNPTYMHNSMERVKEKSSEEVRKLLVEGFKFIERYITTKDLYALKLDMFAMAIDVAKASGGVFGMFKISQEEQEMVDLIKADMIL